MKLGQLTEYVKRHIFSSKIMQKVRQGRLVPEVKVSGLQLSFNIFQ